MAAFSDYLEQGVLNHTLRGSTLATPAAVYVALFTADPTDAGSGAEVADSGYARQDAAKGAAIDTGWNAPSTSGAGYVCTNAKTLEYPPIADGQVTVTHWAIFDASVGGNLLFHGVFDTPRTLQIDDVVSISSGALSITLE